MKKRLLSNRVRNAILMAILLQSVIFGIGLMVTGTFSGTANRPYKVMESQVAEKDALISGYMNNSLLIANTMEKELAKLKDDRKIHDRLIDNLNHASSVDGVFYLDLDKKEAVIYRDGEPQIFSSAYGDIYCVVGSSKSEYPIALSKDWSPKLTPEEWAKAELFWTDRTKGGGEWFFDDNRLYYVISQEVYGSRRMMGFQISGEVLDSYLSLDNPPYKGMEVLLMTDKTILYSRDKAFIGTDYDYRGDGSRISLTYNGASYDGVRSVLQVYGHMEGGSVYVGAVCYHSELAELSRSTIVMVAGVYLLSIVIAIIFSYIAIWMVLKPIKKLHEDITCQNPEEVHFRESGIEEIDRIHQALNDMAAKLEQSYSRYSFTLESAGEKVGSFEYQEGGSRVKLSSSILQLLDIGADRMGADGCLDYDVWEDILGGLDRVMELEDGFSYTDRMCNTRAVSIRQRHEEHGVFGIVMDKTDAYMEILRLRNISQHDQLTGLYNASYLKKEGQKILDGNRSRVNALVFCDLDNLKFVNDNYGHEMGDHYLKAMADLLTDIAFGEQCMAVRLSGDEFVLFFYGYSERKTIEDKVRSGYEGRSSIQLPDGTSRRINASIGLAFAQRESESMEDLINRADRAMYRVKRTEKNGIAIYDKSDEAGPV